MSVSVRGSFPANILLPPSLNFITNRIKNPLALQKVFDRCLGFVHWDFGTTLTYVKLVAVTILLVYYLLSCFCIICLIDPTNLHPDHYLRMWFFIGAGAFCTLRWIALIPARYDFATIHTFLDELQSQKLYHPLRLRSRPVIFICSAILFSMNASISVFWTILLYYSCPIAYAFHNPIIQATAYAIYPAEVFLVGTVANVTTMNTLTTMLVFTVEFDIVGLDLREAFNSMDLDEIKRCIDCHQRLLEMVTLFRRVTKSYFLFAMGLYFFLVTFSCLLLLVQLHEGDFHAMRFNVVNAAIPIVSIVLYGIICDMVEDRIRKVGDRVYDTDWPSTLVYVRGRRSTYLTQKCSLLMIITRSQRKVGFTCGGIFEMSIVTSMQALKLFYTAFTVLWNATSNHYE